MLIKIAVSLDLNWKREWYSINIKLVQFSLVTKISAENIFFKDRFGSSVCELHIYLYSFDVCFNVILIPFLLASWGTFSFNKLGAEDLFWKVKIRHADVTSQSELVLSDGGSDCGDVSLLLDAHVGVLIFPTDPEEFLEFLMICL